MPLQIEVSELADRQIQEADLWWRKNRDKAPNAIREELARIGALIAFRPHVGARAELVEIVAFWGSRRGSGPPI